MLDFLNIWEIFNSQGVPDKYIQPDGIHPDEEGMDLISRSVFDYIVGNNVLNDNNSGQK